MDSDCDESFTTESTCFFGTPDQAFYNAYKNNLKKNSVPYECKHNEVSFIQQGYSFTILHTPNLHAHIPVIKLTAFYLRMESGKFFV